MNLKERIPGSASLGFSMAVRRNAMSVAKLVDGCSVMRRLGGSITDNAPSPSNKSWKARRIILSLFMASQLPRLGTETAYHDRGARDIVGLRGRDDAADRCSYPTDD